MAASGIPDGRGDWIEPGGPHGESAPEPKADWAAWADKTAGRENAADKTTDDITAGGMTTDDMTAGGMTTGDQAAGGMTAGDQAEDGRAGRVDYLRPLSNELIAAVLDAREYRYFTDSDGDIGGRWDDNLFYFFRFGSDGEMLQVRVMVKYSFTTGDVPRLYEFCNEWNHDRLWPKAYVHVYDDGLVRVCGEVMADLTAGVAFNQLAQLIDCGIETGLHMADAVAELQDA